MTEKRFKETISTGIVTDIVTGKEYNCEMRIDDDLLKSMNKLAKENEQFKKALVELKEIGDYQAGRIKELNDENEQLKTQLQNTSDQRDEFFRGARENANRVGKLKKENEQLKQKLQQYRKFLNDDLDIALGFISHKGYSLKDLKEYEKKLKGDVE